MMNDDAKSYGCSAIWPELNNYLLSLNGIPKELKSKDKLRNHFKNIISGFDSITESEFKNFYKFKIYLNNNKSDIDELSLIEQAFREWTCFNYQDARDTFLRHMHKFPMDVVALFFLHMFDFCTGQTERLINLFPYCDQFISEEHPLFSFYLAIKSFVQCENQLFSAALDSGLAAIQLDNHNIYGLHAVTHALHEQGLWTELANFLEKRQKIWIKNCGMRMHIYWHLAICYEKQGNLEKANFLFEELYALKEHEFSKQDLDAVGILWRLRLRNFTAPHFDTTWKTLSALWSGSIGASTSYFHKLHAALAFSACNAPLMIKKLIAESDGFATAPHTHAIGIEVLEAILLLTIGNYPDAAHKLKITEAHWTMLGGSRAQREILSLTLSYAQQQQLAIAS